MEQTQTRTCWHAERVRYKADSDSTPMDSNVPATDREGPPTSDDNMDTEQTAEPFQAQPPNSLNSLGHALVLW